MRDDLLTPISGHNPAGVDLRYELYDIIREARREETDVPAGGADRPRRTADWALVAQLTSDALATRSKDLQLAVWLIEATYHRESFAGFAAAVRMTAQLLQSFWDHLYPELENGDPEARIAPLAWLGSDRHPLSRAIRLAPVTTSGLTIFEFRDAQGVGFDVPAEEYDETEAHKKAIRLTTSSRKEYDRAVTATPKAWYQQRAADVAAALDALGTLARVGSEKFGGDAPVYTELRTAIEEVQVVVLEHLGRKRAPEPDPDPAVEPPTPSIDMGLHAPPKPSPEDPSGEDVRFTVYRPAVVRPEEWYPLLAFAHAAEGKPDNDGRDPEAAVAHQAAQVLEGRIDEFRRVVQDSSSALPREGTITFVPAVRGFEFNPPRRSFQWREAVHREEFRLRASSSLDGQTARGTMTVYHGVIILAEIALTIRVDSSQTGQAAESAQKHVKARPFRKIFASYSRRDLEVVRQFERYATGVGDRYLRDVTDLRAGEDWNERLCDLIREADVLQLFWSYNSMASPFVRREWEYALSLGRANFIRPTYWEDPLPATADGSLPPDALRRLHFQKIALSPERTVPGTPMRCANCGAVPSEGAGFCSQCGASVTNTATSAPSAAAPKITLPRPAESPITAAPSPEYPEPRASRPPAPAYSAPSPMRGRPAARWVAISAAFWVAVLIVAVVIVWLVFS